MYYITYKVTQFEIFALNPLTKGGQGEVSFFQAGGWVRLFQFHKFFFKRRKNCGSLGISSLNLHFQIQYMVMRQEKLICSFVFELSGFSPKAVVMTRWLPFWIKEHDCSHWEKRGHLALPEKMEESVCFFLMKGAKIIILNCNLIKKGICGQTSMEKFKLENNNFGFFCMFFPIYFFLNEVAISVPFCLGSSGFFTLCCNEISIR